MNKHVFLVNLQIAVSVVSSTDMNTNNVVEQARMCQLIKKRGALSTEELGIINCLILLASTVDHAINSAFYVLHIMQLAEEAWRLHERSDTNHNVEQ